MISSTLDVDWELRETGPTEARHGVLLLPGGGRLHWPADPDRRQLLEESRIDDA
jgi:hypothetical protein